MLMQMQNNVIKTHIWNCGKHFYFSVADRWWWIDNKCGSLCFMWIFKCRGHIIISISCHCYDNFSMSAFAYCIQCYSVLKLKATEQSNPYVSFLRIFRANSAYLSPFQFIISPDSMESMWSYLLWMRMSLFVTMFGLVTE